MKVFAEWQGKQVIAKEGHVFHIYGVGVVQAHINGPIWAVRFQIPNSVPGRRQDLFIDSADLELLEEQS